MFLLYSFSETFYILSNLISILSSAGLDNVFFLVSFPSLLDSKQLHLCKNRLRLDLNAVA